MSTRNPIFVTEADGTKRFVQIVGISDNYGKGLRVNGRFTGTLFGDDVRTTRRNPILSSSWSHGLPVHAIDIELIGNAKWYILPDINNPIYFDGVCVLESGETSTGKIFITTKKKNRYEGGQLSYFIYTAAFIGLDTANGDYEMLIGAMTRGLASDGNFGKIKEGMVFGHVVESGVYKHVFRVYKNYEYNETELVDIPNSEENLNIYRLEVGYLGIHPAFLYKLNLDSLEDKLVHSVVFRQDTTSVSSAYLAMGVYLENKGNTSNLSIRNGSIQFGNYAERTSPDPSARSLNDDFQLATIISGTDVVIAAYTVPEKLTMIKEYALAGTLSGSFVNNIANKLLNVQAKGTANKDITLNIYLVPKADVTATYTDLNPLVNTLQRAITTDITASSIANGERILSLTPINTGRSEDVSKFDFLLTSDLVALVAVSCSQSITDFSMTVNTEDLF